MNSVTEAESKNKKNQEIRSKIQRRARLCSASQVIKTLSLLWKPWDTVEGLSLQT